MAEDFYRSRGFSIEARNVRFGRLEADLVVRQGPLLIVVEVRARGPGSYQRAFASVAGPKLRRLRAAVQAAWRRWGRDPSLQRVRLDVVAVDLWRRPVEVEVAEAVSLGLRGLARSMARGEPQFAWRNPEFARADLPSGSFRLGVRAAELGVEKFRTGSSKIRTLGLRASNSGLAAAEPTASAAEAAKAPAGLRCGAVSRAAPACRRAGP